MADPAFDQIADEISKTYPKSCIVWMERVANAELERRFERRRSEMPECETLRLFHGTDAKNLPSILEGGFDSKRNVRSAYGRGTYFATEARLSKEYMVSNHELNFMLCCDVLVKKRINSQNRKVQVTPGDCFVDNVRKPAVWVVQDDDCAYPRYIVAFFRNPKM